MSQVKWHAERIREHLHREIAWAITNKVNDPSIRDLVTVTDIKLAQDTRNATIYVSVYGEKEQKEKAISALNRAAPFIQRCISPRISLKNFPKLYFKIDSSLERGQHINSLLEQVKDDLV
ncbi:30S ribosome-binding factor RbfA [Fibrobacterota bacterium]